MQLLTLAGILLFVGYSVATQGTEGPCDKARRDAGQAMPGKFIPQCTQYGFFKPAQCSGSTGFCWCVNPETGKKIEKSEGRGGGLGPQCTICNIQRSEALRPQPFVGQYVPICDEDGLFDSTQRHGSTGQSWCVNRYTGEELPGTRVAPGQERSKPCATVSLLVGLASYSKLPEQGPCYEKIVEARGHEQTPGFYIPSCTNNGYYKTEQYSSSSGYTWCVNPTTGNEIPGTRRAPAEPRVACGACFKESEEKIRRQPLFGNDLPQCNQENGDYVPVQGREGYRWCVNPTTGAIEGKKYPPGDKTPLPCVNN